MCRSKAEGGRRCDGNHDRESGRESYEGTPWQGYDEYMERSRELDRQVAEGRSITDIMREQMSERVRKAHPEFWPNG